MVQSTPSSINHVTFRNPNTFTSSAFHLAIHIVLYPPSCHLSEVLLHFIYPEDFGLDLYSLSQSPGMLFLLLALSLPLIQTSQLIVGPCALYNKQPWNLDSQLSRTSRTCENREWLGPLIPDNWAITHDSIITALLYWSRKPSDDHCTSWIWRQSFSV